jgi:hypothetical protein
VRQASCFYPAWTLRKSLLYGSTNSRIGLHFGDWRANTSQTVRETDAEAVAFSQAIGLETETASSDSVHLYRGDKATLSESLVFIQRTAAGILAGIDGIAPRDAWPPL